MAAVTRRWAPFSLFYPLSFAAIAAMVGLALKPGIERVRAWREVLATITTEGLVIQGADLSMLMVNERASAEMLEEPGAEPVAIIGSTGLVTNQELNGARYWLPDDAVRALGGQDVVIGLEVRSAPVNGSADWLSRIVLGGAFDTGWQPQTAGPEWSTVRIPVSVPVSGTEGPMDIILWSDASGDGGRIELRRIAIEPAGPT